MADARRRLPGALLTIVGKREDKDGVDEAGVATAAVTPLPTSTLPFGQSSDQEPQIASRFSLLSSSAENEVFTSAVARKPSK